MREISAVIVTVWFRHGIIIRTLSGAGTGLPVIQFIVINHERTV